MLWYKADMFEEAGLEPPPHEYGEKYKMPDGTEVEWNYDTVRELAQAPHRRRERQRRDEAGFDPKNIVQYGFEPQRDDLRGLGAYCGAGSLAAADGKTVQIPDAWKTAWKFWYDGMWTDHTIMTGPVFESDEFSGGGYAFFSGQVAMSENFLWTTYGVADAGDGLGPRGDPVPQREGHLAAQRGHVRDPQGHQEPGRRRSRRSHYLLGEASDKLLGCTAACRPGRTSRMRSSRDSASRRTTPADQFPDEVDWQVAKDSVQFADNPNFEASMPKYNETLDILTSTRPSGSDRRPGHGRRDRGVATEIQAVWDDS